jgi:LEA14-like dessication related protein
MTWFGGADRTCCGGGNRPANLSSSATSNSVTGISIRPATIRFVSWLLAQAVFALLASAAIPADIRVIPELEGFMVILSGAKPDVAAGAFSGSVSLNGSSSEIPVTGLVRASGELLELSVRMRYRDVPEDWIKRSRASDFDYRLRGRVAGGTPVEWSGTRRWNQVEVEKREDAASGFVRLTSIQLTEFSLLESAARAEITVRNPLAFPLKLATASYRLFANGREVGSGSNGEMILRPGQETTLKLPIDLDHGQLLAAAGSALRSGNDVEGRLRGALALRLPGGDIPVPFDLSGQFSILQ